MGYGVSLVYSNLIGLQPVFEDAFAFRQINLFSDFEKTSSKANVKTTAPHQ
jgi:hypothetical protein